MEKNIKNNVYKCVPESLCWTAEINTTWQSDDAVIYKNKQESG